MRNTTEKTYQRIANQVIDYISRNLDQYLKLETIANQVNVSQRQLLRIMHSYLNESLYSYISRQRIERAVLYMQTEETSLSKIALMVGYENPQSFSKAFKKQFGISPKAYMNELNKKLNAFTKKNKNANKHLISEVCEEQDANLIYIRVFGKYGEEDAYTTAWNKLLHFLKTNEALSKDTRFIGISFDDPNVTNPEQCRFYACASVQKTITPNGEFGVIQLRHGKYAVYKVKGNYSSLQEIYNNIYVNFEYTLRHGVGFEEYINCFESINSEDMITKIFIPIK